MENSDTILVFDFGGQYCHLIARRIREQKVYSEIVPCDVSPQEVLALRKRFNIKGLILSGGPSSVYEKGAPTIDSKVLDLGFPVLGLCYGHQIIAHVLGGEVSRGKKQEYGLAYVTIINPVGVLKGLGPTERVWMSHSDLVYKLPDDFEILAKSEACPIAAYRHLNKPIYGLQWHPEVTHTEHGTKMLRNFIFEVCKCQPSWKPASAVDQKALKEIAGKGKAIIALSGGIDSSTAAVIAAKILGKNLTAVFVDHGFMREGEGEEVRGIFKRLGVNVTVIDARERFMRKICGIVDPEKKRMIIGREFIKVFEEIASKVGAKYLIQGTIYPDRIESGFKRRSDRIKSHHNVAGLPTKIKFKAIIEPLRNLYKDEVREVAKSLGLPEEIVNRQPFPGPGLAVRVIGEVTPEKVEIVRKADKIVAEEIERSGLNKRVWQYFAVLTGIKSTGVKGDARVYGNVIAVRIVKSQEAMTASFAKIPYEILERISTRITNEIPSVTRVVYDITHKPPATIEWE